MKSTAERATFIFGLITLFGFVLIFLPALGFDVIANPAIPGNIAALVLALFGCAALSFVAVYGGFLPGPKRSGRLRAIKQRFGDFTVDCAVEGAELLDLGEIYPNVEVLADGKSPLSLIASRYGLGPSKLTSALAHSEAPMIDDRHIVLRDRLARLDGTATGWRTDYRAVRTITKLRSGKGLNPARPNVLSGNALLVDRPKRMVGLQIRSDAVETSPGNLHVLGGAFEPINDNSLAYTAEREVREETKNGVSVSTMNCITILQHEIATNYTMVVFLGASAEIKTSDSSNWEGSLRWFPLESIPELLTDKARQWVPTGKQAVIAWLSLGCPVGESDFAFGRRKARKLMDEYHRLARRS